MNKNFFIIIVLMLLSLIPQHWAKAQVPEKLSFQAVVRDNNDNLITNSAIGIKISILQGSATGEEIYIETHQPSSNANGLVTLEIGTGLVITGEFENIDWSNGPYFLKTETDPNGGFNYTISGTSQLLSVPFALHAKTAESISGANNIIDSIVSNYLAAGITATDTSKWNNKLDSLTGNEVAFQRWDKNVSDDFSGSYNDLTGKPTQVSHFSNDTGYLTHETDPDFNDSPASEITSTDIFHLNNISGVNTGDQDLSGLVLKTVFADSTAQLRNEISNLSSLIITETDPVFIGSVAAGITQEDTAAWNAASIGSYVETDPVFMAWDKSSGISITQSQISDLSFDVFEKELTDNENNIDVGFNLLSTSIIFINGITLLSSEWTGIGTQILNLNLETKLFDKIKVIK